MEFFAVIAALVGIVTTIIWIVIGWRAMRAHERMADTASEWMLLQRSDRMANRPKTNPPQANKQAPLIPQQSNKNEDPKKPWDATGDKPAS